MNILCGKRVNFTDISKIDTNKQWFKDMCGDAYLAMMKVIESTPEAKELNDLPNETLKYIANTILKSNYSNSKNFNALNSKLNPKLDGFLQDVAQFSGKIDYSDIMKFEPNKDQITDLNKLMKDCKSLFEDGADEEDPEVIECFDKVVKILRAE